MATMERQWSMRRLDTGDYLLPANSVKETGRYYRIRKWEDGPNLGAEARRFVWSVFVGQEDDLDELSLRLVPWDMREWTEIAECSTRGDAVVAALEHDAKQVAP